MLNMGKEQCPQVGTYDEVPEIRVYQSFLVANPALAGPETTLKADKRPESIQSGQSSTADGGEMQLNGMVQIVDSRN